MSALHLTFSKKKEYLGLRTAGTFYPACLKVPAVRYHGEFLGANPLIRGDFKKQSL